MLSTPPPDGLVCGAQGWSNATTDGLGPSASVPTAGGKVDSLEACAERCEGIANCNSFVFLDHKTVIPGFGPGDYMSCDFYANVTHGWDWPTQESSWLLYDRRCFQRCPLG